MSGRYEFTIRAGATWRKRIVWKDSEGVARDLTGWSGRMQIRQRITDDDVLLELTTENGGITITPLLGQVDLYIKASDTLDLTDWAVTDLELYKDDDAEEVKRLVEADIRVSPEVTRESGS